MNNFPSLRAKKNEKTVKRTIKSLCREKLFADCFMCIGQHACGGDLMRGNKTSGYASNLVECFKCGWHMMLNKDD